MNVKQDPVVWRDDKAYLLIQAAEEVEETYVGRVITNNTPNEVAPITFYGEYEYSPLKKKATSIPFDAPDKARFWVIANVGICLQEHRKNINPESE